MNPAILNSPFIQITLPVVITILFNAWLGNRRWKRVLEKERTSPLTRR